ncbi:U6 snRNA-associated Sm-like protein LSm3 isoform X1 [Oratosquilla oratoria]|uniref:U6 snRNA-associated Sm-like protein LSm3 isoform X1 n=1 Tax=Oratosquilla oratoria TaxID=337810 RepID=UPI003F767BDF
MASSPETPSSSKMTTSEMTLSRESVEMAPSPKKTPSKSSSPQQCISGIDTESTSLIQAPNVITTPSASTSSTTPRTPGSRGRPSASGSDLTLPPQRVKMIMKCSPDVEMVTQESLHLITKATELFVQYLAEESYSRGSNRACVTYEALSDFVHAEDHLEFLKETLPKKLTWAECQKLLAKHEEKMESFVL